MTTDGYLLRSATPEDGPAVTAMVAQAFGRDPDPDEIAADMLVFEPDRDHVVVKDDRIVANLGAYTREITVPGAVLPAAHVSMAGVKAEHTRRGLLTRLIRYQFQTMPESVAVLWASEGRIYQRFGYGQAAPNAPLDIDASEVSLLPRAPVGPGVVTDADPVTVLSDLVKVYDQVRVTRPGWSGRDAAWWKVMLSDPSCRRVGASRKRLSVYSAPTGIEGYAFWRTKSSWDDGRPTGEVEVLEIVAATPQAYTALWRQLLSIDLTRRVGLFYGAIDEPLRFLVSDPRLLRPKIREGLWLRLVDLPAALAGRCYATPVDVVFEVSDEVLPANAGRYRLRAGTGEPASCERTENPADLGCDVATLASAYLGGVSLLRLADCGQVEEYRPGALAEASVAFGWSRMPSPSEMF